MEKYILEIFKDSNTVIIPGLGALTATNKEKGEYMFMSFLKHDDGVLRNLIASSEGCEQSAATDKIVAFVDQVKAKINAGEPFDLKGFGVFGMDSTGDVTFESGSTDNSKVEPKVTTDLPIVDNEVVPEVVPTIVEEVIEEIIVAEAPVAEEEKEEIILEEMAAVEIVAEDVKAEEIIEEIVLEEVVPESVVEEVVAVEPEIIVEEELTPIVDEVKTVIIESAADDLPEEILVHTDVVSGGHAESTVEKDYSEQQQWEDDLDLPPINAKVERPKKPIIEKTKKDKKRKSTFFYVMLVFLVLLVGGGTTVGLFYNQIKTALFAEKSNDLAELSEDKQFEFTEDNDQEDASDEAEETPEETTAIPEEIPEVKEEVAPVKEVKTAPVINGSYFLIVGSFQSEANATNFSNRMKSEGNESSVLGPNNGFYLVAIGSYSTEGEAKQGLSDKIGKYPKVWLYKKS